jgi:hypothetical protein
LRRRRPRWVPPWSPPRSPSVAADPVAARRCYRATSPPQPVPWPGLPQSRLAAGRCWLGLQHPYGGRSRRGSPQRVRQNAPVTTVRWSAHRPPRRRVRSGSDCSSGAHSTSVRSCAIEHARCLPHPTALIHGRRSTSVRDGARDVVRKTKVPSPRVVPAPPHQNGRPGWAILTSTWAVSADEVQRRPVTHSSSSNFPDKEDLMFVPSLCPRCTSVVILSTDSPGSARCRSCRTVVCASAVVETAGRVPARLRALSPDPPVQSAGLVALQAA